MVINELIVPHKLEEVCEIIDNSSYNKDDLNDLILFLLDNYDLEVSDKTASKFYKNMGTSIMYKLHNLITKAGDLEITKPSDITELVKLSQQLIDFSKPSKNSNTVLSEDDQLIFDMIEGNSEE